MAVDALHDIEAASDEYPDLPAAQQAAARDAIERRWQALDTELANPQGASFAVFKSAR